MKDSDIMGRLVGITKFNNGQASKIIHSVQETESIFILKNNKTAAVLLSPAQYTLICEFAEECIELLSKIEIDEKVRDRLKKKIAKTNLVNAP